MKRYKIKMALNPSYEAIGKGFVQQYYALFDDPTQRPNLINMYNVSNLSSGYSNVTNSAVIRIKEMLLLD